MAGIGIAARRPAAWLLGLLLFLAAEAASGKPQGHDTELLAFRPTRLQGVPLVQGSAELWGKRDTTLGVAYSGSAWPLMFQLTANPDALEKVAAAFEKVGPEKMRREAGYGMATLANGLFTTFVPAEAQHRYRGGIEMDQVRKFRAFVEDYREDFAALRLRTPARIGFARRVSLGPYDPVRQGFVIEQDTPRVRADDRLASGHRPSGGVSFLPKRPPRRIDFLPFAPGQAEQLLRTLKHREVIFLAAYRMTEISPGEDGGAAVRVEDEVFAVYHPQLLTKPIAVLRDPAPRAEPTTGGPADGVEQRMAELTKEFDLLEYQGLPVIGYETRGNSDANLFARSNRDKQLLYDLMRVHYDPDLFTRESEERRDFDFVPLLLRHFGPGEVGRYANLSVSRSRGDQRWLGENEFERRRARAACVETLGARLQKQSIGAPLRMVLYGECHIGGYDFDQKCFAVHAELPLHHENRLPIYDLDKTDTSAPSLTAPLSLRTPNRWVMTPEEAERFVATLPPVRPGYNSRTLHLAVEVDLPDAPLARAVLDDGPDGPAYVHGFGLYVRANKATLFKDPLLNSRFAELPIDVSLTPTLAGGALDPPRPNDPPLLDDDFTWVGLMLREKATPSPSDWARAAWERLSQDNTFYEKGRPSHLLDARRDQRRFNDDYDSNNRLRINVPLNKIRGGFYEPGYQPFFPEGFDPTHDSPSPLTDEQNELLGKSAVSRLGNGRMVLAATASRSASDNAYDVEPSRAGAIPSRDSQVWEAIGEDPAAVTAWDLRDPDDLLEAGSSLTRLVVVLPFGPRELRLSGPEWDERVASFAERRVDLDFDVRLQLQFGKFRVVPSRDEEGRPLQIALLYADPVDLSVLAPEDRFVHSTERTVIATLPITRAAPVEAGPPILAGPPDDAASVAAVGVAMAEPKPSAPPLPQEDVVETAVAQAREVTPAAGEQASPPTSPTTSLTPPALSPHWESLLAALAKIPPAEGALVGTGAFAAIVLLGGVWKLLRHRSRESEAPTAMVSPTLDQLSRVSLPRSFHAIGQKAYENSIGKPELPEQFGEIDRLRGRLRSAKGESAQAVRRALSEALVRLGAAVAANTSIAGRSALAEELRVAEELQRVIAESQGLVAAPSGR